MDCKENDSQCLEWINEYIENYKTTDNFNRVARKLIPIRANKTSVLYELKVEKEHVNGKNTIHGGQIASLVDIVTATVVSLTIRDIPMVSVEIATSYLLPALIDEDITIEGIVLKIGRNMAFAEAEFRRKRDGALIAKGKHTLCLLNHLKKNDGKVISQ
uniref:Acyl-coenzyme A thioesterase 13 n=1 Tax=Strongyloides papillosus TaxID=174720 RepID=A0A0N5BYZ6_STREA